MPSTRPCRSVSRSPRSYAPCGRTRRQRRRIAVSSNCLTPCGSRQPPGAMPSSRTSIRAELLYHDDAWRIRAQVQEFPDHRHLDRRRRAALFAGSAGGGLRPVALDRQTSSLRLSSEVTNFPEGRGADGVCARICPRSCAGQPAVRAIFFEPTVGYHYTQYDSAKRRGGRSEHAYPHLAVREPRYRIDLRAGRGVARSAHPDTGASPGLYLHPLPQSK